MLRIFIIKYYYIYANIYNLGSFKPLFTLKIKGKITLAHNFIHLYNDKIFDIVVINIQSFKKNNKILNFKIFKIFSSLQLNVHYDKWMLFWVATAG